MGYRKHLTITNIPMPRYSLPFYGNDQSDGYKLRICPFQNLVFRILTVYKRYASFVYSKSQQVPILHEQKMPLRRGPIS